MSNYCGIPECYLEGQHSHAASTGNETYNYQIIDNSAKLEAEKIIDEIHHDMDSCVWLQDDEDRFKKLIASALKSAKERGFQEGLKVRDHDVKIACELNEKMAKEAEARGMRKAAAIIAKECDGKFHALIPDGGVCFIHRLEESILAAAEEMEK